MKNCMLKHEKTYFLKIPQYANEILEQNRNWFQLLKKIVLPKCKRQISLFSRGHVTLHPTVLAISHAILHPQPRHFFILSHAIFHPQSHHFSSSVTPFLVACYVTLHPTLLVHPSVRPSHFTFLAFIGILAIPLLPKCSTDLKYGPFPPACDWDSSVSGLVSYKIDFSTHANEIKGSKFRLGWRLCEMQKWVSFWF